MCALCLFREDIGFQTLHCLRITWVVYKDAARWAQLWESLTRLSLKWGLRILIYHKLPRALPLLALEATI